MHSSSLQPVPSPSSTSIRGISYLRKNGIRVVTWNCNGLFLHAGAGPTKQSAKQRLLLRLLDASDLLALQETHGDSAHLHELQKQLPFHQLYGSFCEHRGMGGVIIAVRHTLLHRSTTALSHQVVPGRALRLLLDGPEMALNFLNIHLDTSLPQHHQHSLLTRIFHMRDLSMDFTTILAGDFNFTFPGDCRLRLSDTRQLPSDDPLGTWFSEHSDPFKAIHYDGFSRVGFHVQPDGSRTPAILSAIDHIMSDLPPAELQDLRPLCAIRCNPLEFPHSDHVPVILLLRPLTPADEKPTSWPTWLYSTKEYAEAMKALAACTLLRNPTLLEAKQFLTNTLDEVFLQVSSRQAATIPEHLYWATRALRLSRLGATKCILRCISASPPLQAHFDHAVPKPSLFDHIRELTLQSSTASSTPTTSPDAEVHVRKQLRHVRLWRRCGTRVRNWSVRVSYTTAPLQGSEAADALRDYWGKVFSRTATSPAAAQTLLRHVPADQVSGDFRHSPAEVEDLLKSQRDSAPGPDGLRYRVWLDAGPCFHSALSHYVALTTAGNPMLDADRAGATCFVPKLLQEDDSVLVSDLRPLTLMNTSYKVLAAIANRLLAAALPAYIADLQKGFMQGRLGIEHVFTVEALAAALTRLDAPRSVIILLDLLAAFPSVAHEFMLQVVDRFCGAHPLRDLLHDLYTSGTSSIRFSGAIYEGFPIQAGVRQGCPLSGSLFVLVFHCVLLELDLRLASSSFTFFKPETSAYADDVAVVAEDLLIAAPIIQQVFDLATLAINLRLKPQKSIIVPCIFNPVDRIRDLVHTHIPEWTSFSIRSEAIYFGVLLGPRVVHHHRWTATMDKLLCRVALLCTLHAGWSTLTRLFNMVILPLLSHLWQLVPLPTTFNTTLQRAICRLYRLPYNRVPCWLFCHLRQLGFSTNLLDAHRASLAARGRLALQSGALPAVHLRYIRLVTDERAIFLAPPEDDWNSDLCITHLLWSLPRINLIAKTPFLAWRRGIQRSISKSLAVKLPDNDFLQLFTSRLRVVLPPDAPAEHYAMTALSLLQSAGSFPGVLRVSTLKLVCNAWQTGTSATHVCIACGLRSSASLRHLFACEMFPQLLQELFPRLPWPFEARVFLLRFFFGAQGPWVGPDLRACIVHDLLWSAITGRLRSLSPAAAVRARADFLRPLHRSVAQHLLSIL